MIEPGATTWCSATATALAAVVALALLAIAAPAEAAPAGSATLVSNGPAADSLRSQGVRIAPVSPATGSGVRARLPISAGLAGSSTSLLRLGGGISFSRGRDSVRLTKLSLLLSGRRSRVRAQLGGEPLDAFAVANRGSASVESNSGAIDLGALRLRLTGAGAGKLAAKLGVRTPRKRTFGVLGGSVHGLGSAGPAPETPAETASEGCPKPTSAGPPPETPLPVAARPATAGDISSASVTWQVRESFIRYINSGEGTSVSGGAVADPPVVLPGSSAALSYGFHFPFSGGWADPASGTAAVDFGGAVRFLYSAHGIDLTTASPEIEIAGDRSRAIFAIADSGGAPERQVLVNLDLAHAASITAAAGTVTYDRIPAAIPAGTASSVFAGFYTPGTDFGCVSLSYSAS